MEFKSVIFGRRSVRRYLDRPIPDEDLQYILDAGMYAPSGVNLQPWYFVVIRSREKMSRFLELMEVCGERNEAHLMDRFKADPQVARDSIAFIKSLGGAPVVMLAFRGRPSYPLTDEGIVQSIAAAMENMLLAAYDRGISSCWLTAPLQAGMQSSLRDEFAPGRGDLVCIATFGYGASIPKAVPRKEGRYVII